MIDFKKIPVDTLVDVMSWQGGGILTLHFQKQTDDGCYFCTSYTSATSLIYTCNEWANSHRAIRISAKNPWMPWFGGECPVPENCMVETIHRDGLKCEYDAGDIDWCHYDFEFNRQTRAATDIIAYRLLESPWQTIEGVWG